MNFVGLDLSFTETGAVRINYKGTILGRLLLSTDSKMKPEERIDYISRNIRAFLMKKEVAMVYIEDKFVGANKKQALKDGGLLYHTILLIMEEKHPYKIINPTTLKSFVIGTKGKKKGSKKELMLLHCFKKWGEEFENNNLCDAYCLARMAMEDWLKKELLKPAVKVKRVKRTV